MRKVLAIIYIAVFMAFISPGDVQAGGWDNHSKQDVSQNGKKVEVVFVLDTTGSMSGLIEGAKNKIWYIATEIQNGKPTPDVEMGLIGYRDRGDDYVTKIYPISEDIHEIYGHLLEFQAKGGGDTPESVNQALHEAVHQMNWGEDKDTLRVIFLVGDAPPKMNYQDDVKYRETVLAARDKGIIINTVLCGNSHETAEIWKEIAQYAGGEFSAIPQSGNVTVITTPYDEEIRQLNITLNNTAIVYGNVAQKRSASSKLDKMKYADAEESADMASFNSYRKTESQIFTGRGELLKDIDDGVAELDSVKDDELPENMRNMSADERKEYVASMRKKREEVQHKLDELAAKRARYIEEERSKLSEEKKDAFDYKVIDIIKEQGRAKGIAY